MRNKCRSCNQQGVYMRDIFRNGVTHVVEVCPACKTNLRPAAYVPRLEVEGDGFNVNTLPLHKDHRAADAAQPSLFG